MTEFYRFEEGQSLKAIYFGDGELSVGTGGVARIEVVMEYGQIGMVPWFAAFDMQGNCISKFNAALVDGVAYPVIDREEETKP